MEECSKCFDFSSRKEATAALGLASKSAWSTALDLKKALMLRSFYLIGDLLFV